MKSIEFPEITNAVGKDQSEYETLYAHVAPEEFGAPFTYCMELDATELAQVNNTRRVWLRQLTFGKGFQPIALSMLKPEDIGPDLLPVAEPDGVQLIAQERAEQRDAHGWDEQHDDRHGAAELKGMASYLLTKDPRFFPECMPFELRKRLGRKKGVEALKVAGALIAAEIDRLQRRKALKLASARAAKDLVNETKEG